MNDPSDAEREAARRYPYGRVPTVGDFQQDLFREVFVAGADWQRAILTPDATTPPPDIDREALKAKVLELGVNELHYWRCEYPDRYGPCTCVDEFVVGLIEALPPVTPESETN